jgi:hypothetical protein
MPYTIKTTWYFAGYEQGFSESFYWTKSNNDLNDAETLVTPLMQKRAALLAKGYTLIIGRNAIVEGLAAQKIKRQVDIFEPRIAGRDSWAAAAPNYSLMCVWQNALNTEKKPQYMRGIPAGLGDLGKLPNLAYGTWLSYFNSWRSAMVAFPAQWRITSATQNASITNYVMSATTGIVTLTFGGAGFTWPVNPGYQTPVYVKLPNKNPMDGSLLVVPVDATHAYTARPYGVQPFPVGQLGVAEIRTPTLTSLAPAPGGTTTGAIHPQRIVTHKTGDPSSASRGRVANRVHW